MTSILVLCEEVLVIEVLVMETTLNTFKGGLKYFKIARIYLGIDYKFLLVVLGGEFSLGDL